MALRSGYGILGILRVGSYQSAKGWEEDSGKGTVMIRSLGQRGEAELGWLGGQQKKGGLGKSKCTLRHTEFEKATITWKCGPVVGCQRGVH